MKVVAFCGSPKKEGNTATLLKCVLMELEKSGIESELIQLGGKKVNGCLACNQCFKNKNKLCSNDTDIINSCIQKMNEADGIILGSPTYFSNVSTEIKALIDRAGLVAIANDYSLKHKVGAAVVAVRRAGGTNVFSAINYFFLINQMIIPGSTYWNLGVGLKPGDVLSDEEGMGTMKVLGENMAHLMKKLN